MPGGCLATNSVSLTKCRSLCALKIVLETSDRCRFAFCVFFQLCAWVSCVRALKQNPALCAPLACDCVFRWFHWDCLFHSWSTAVLWQVRLVTRFLSCNNSSGIKIVVLPLCGSQGFTGGSQTELGHPLLSPAFLMSSPSITVSHKLINLQPWTLQGNVSEHLFSI